MLATGKRCNICRQILIRDEEDVCDDCIYEFEEMDYLMAEERERVKDWLERN